VTQWLNIAGIAALGILLWNLLATPNGPSRRLRFTLLSTWVFMAAIEVELFLLHPAMDRLMVTQPVRMILNEDHFELLHRTYLVSTTIQWFLGLLHVWCICTLWGARV
jgi:hypothetical protein